MNQAEARKIVLERRRELTERSGRARSLAIIRRFLDLKRDFKGRFVTLYRGMQGELDLSELERALLAQGALVAYPRVVSKQLEFFETSLADTDWERGPLGIWEPRTYRPKVEAKDLGAIIVPGVAFGRSMERTGMGSGFYDRFLARVPKAIRIGLCFDFQLFDRLEQNPWDQKMHSIVTETETL